jgi:hypothetical protein
MSEVKLGDISRNGLYQITDTSWDSNGTLRVTVRELIGERGISKARLEAMRRFARRALAHQDQTKSAKTIRTWYNQGCSHATFAVSRLERY